MSEEKSNSFKYINEDTAAQLNIRNIESYEIVSNDTINEEDLLKTVLAGSYKDELFAASLQMAIVGFGGRQFQNYKYRGEIKNLNDLFRRAGVRFNNDQQEKFDTNILTPRRLIRIFRYQIKNYLERHTDIASYLFLKYNSNDMSMRSICFAGGEHLVETQNQADYILNAYKNLDKGLKERQLQHGIFDRVKRVLLAKNFNINIIED